MGRKDLLKGLTGELTAVNSSSEAASETAVLPARAPHLGGLGSRGAIGAVTRSIEQLKAQSVVDIDPDLVEASFIADRLDHSDEQHRALVESMREHGQQVPVLVRPHPTQDGRYQIAYGRRRLLAARELGRKIRAVAKPLSDEQLVIAQGQENSARKDLSFIEKALFAARLEQAGYARVNRMFTAVSPKATKTRQPTLLKAEDGTKFGHFNEDARAVLVSIDKKVAGDFASYLIGTLPELYAAFKRRDE